MSPSRAARARFLLKDLGGLALYYPGQALVARTPRPVLAPLVRVGGDVARWMARDGALMREELRLLFGHRPLPASEDTLVHRAYRAAMHNEIEVLRYPELSPSTIDDVCVLEGRHHLDAALARGRGVILLLQHFGANQIVMPALGHRGYTMSQLSAPPPVWAEILRDVRTTPLWEKVLARRWELEKRLPVQHINVFRFLRPAFDALARGEILAVAFDGGGGQRFAPVQLLARTARVSVQPIQLWRKSGAALLPTFVVREDGQARHRVILGEPLTFATVPGDRSEEERRNLQNFVDVFTPWVERLPDHYLQFLLMRRRVRATDVMPFFADYPPAEGQLSQDEAMQRLARAGRWRE